MARLEISIEHGQSPEVAQEKFESGITAAVSRYGSWIGRLDWSEDRRAARVTGAGYEVRLWYDERSLHARGNVPLAWKLFEPAIRTRIQRMIDDTP